jgi:hypothetical protein
MVLTMEKENIQEFLSVSKIGDKALSKIAMYNPNLIANLSKEGYDLYIIRKQVCEFIFPLMTTKDMTVSKLKKIIQEEIERVENLKEGVDSLEEKNFLDLKIEELEDYL